MIKLSELDPNMDVDELIDYLLDFKVYKIVNDLERKKPQPVYSLQDLYEVWDLLRIKIVLQN